MRSSLNFKSESDFLSWVTRQTHRKSPGLSLGIGDDAALVRVSHSKELILTTDMSIEGVHYKVGLHPPEAVGHRALARSLSDVAAMGGTPRYALISLAISQSATRAWVERFFRGFLALARQFSVAVIGGDTAIVPGPGSVDVVVAGVAERGRALRRSTARAGDGIFVSGTLGMSALGLRLLPARTRRHKPEERAALRAHLFPQPQCSLGRFLARRRLASALMDLSDGLSIDLERLCQASSVGATLFADRIPLPPVRNIAKAMDLALNGGEDYQLLFTVNPARAAKIPRRFGNTRLQSIGEIRAGEGIEMVTPEGARQPLKAGGYDHFAQIRHQT